METLTNSKPVMVLHDKDDVKGKTLLEMKRDTKKKKKGHFMMIKSLVLLEVLEF